MKLIFSVFIAAASLVSYSTGHAQSSLLRVVCEGNDSGAEVSINGKFKGECPLDIQVGAGTVKLRAVKKAGNANERVFEQAIRVGDGVVKRVEVVLSAPRIGAARQVKESDRLAAERSETGKREQAREKVLAEVFIPHRPQIPIEVSEDIWQTIEASEAYRNLPRPRMFKVRDQASRDVVFTGAKLAALPKPATSTIDTARENAPLSEKCSVYRLDATTDGKRSGSEIGVYRCGIYLDIGSTINGKPSIAIKSIDELTGSLFPMRIGNRMSIRIQSANVSGSKFDSTSTSSCEVVSQGPASEVDSRLAGSAWKVRCQSGRNIAGSTYKNEYDDYYLEDLGVWLSDIGALDSLKKAFVLPSPGSQTVFVAEGEYGSRLTTTYSGYDWTVGTSDESRRVGLEAIASRGVPKNEAEAIDGDRKAAAAKGDPTAINNLRNHLAEQAAQSRPPEAGPSQSAQSASAGSSLADVFSSVVINRINSNTASALAANGNTGAAALVNSMNSAMLASIQSNGAGSATPAASADSAAASGGTRKVATGPARIFVVSRSTRDDACETSKRMTKADGQEITGTCSCNTRFGANNCSADVVSSKSAAATPASTGSSENPRGLSTAQLKSAALACQASAKQNTGNPQVDTGCSMVAFDVCIFRTTGVTSYNQEAKVECSVLRRTVKATGGPAACEIPCRDAEALPVADPCQHVSNCTR